jgi:hypothetical protein
MSDIYGFDIIKTFLSYFLSPFFGVLPILISDPFQVFTKLINICLSLSLSLSLVVYRIVETDDVGPHFV